MDCGVDISQRFFRDTLEAWTAGFDAGRKGRFGVLLLGAFCGAASVGLMWGLFG